MDAERSYRLTLRAANRDSTVKGTTSEEQAPAVLAVFCSTTDRELHVGVVVVKAVDASWYSGQWRARVRSRLDQASPSSDIWVVTSGMHLMFPIEGPMKKIDKWADGSVLLIEVPIFNGTSEVSRFQIAGLPGELPWLKGSCNAR
jgi:hypothetical protein